jgi:uncharacterized protein YjbI with pentapeptide repeats
MADKLDPFDVEALESAVNDSATRVSAIWISFLIFSLYLLIAATTVTQRQLLLADPIKLPVLNIDLPLWGFFFLAPILFVILHIYVLLQVLLLGRTTAAYNAAVARVQLSPEENISVRQRLANTLFAQIFAGSPREREGFIGALLRAMVWITLAIAPILILLAFQFSFLAYHSHIATWTHRFLILVELAAFFLIWPLALDAQKEFQWPKVGADLRHLGALCWRAFGPKEQRREEWLWLRQRAAPLTASLLFIFVSLAIATFPGEPYANLLTLKSPFSVQCNSWFAGQFGLISFPFDRLILQKANVVEDKKFRQILQNASERGLPPSASERTQNFSGRDLNCSDLSLADLRRVDLTGAHLIGAMLFETDLRGATLEYAQLQGANLEGAQLQVADLYSAQLQGADLGATQLQGADLGAAELKGASLSMAMLQGANLSSANLQGATFNYWAQFHGAQLQGADLGYANLQGTDLDNAQLQGANMGDAELQGASLNNTNLDYAWLNGVETWRAKYAACSTARVMYHDPETIIPAVGPDFKPIPATPDTITKFIEHTVADIPSTVPRRTREDILAQMRKQLVLDPQNDDTAVIDKVWDDCQINTNKISQDKFDDEQARSLINLVCAAEANGGAIAEGIVRTWISKNITANIQRDPDSQRMFTVKLARGLLGQDGSECAAIKDFDKATIGELRAAAAAQALSATASTPPPPPATMMTPAPAPAQ